MKNRYWAFVSDEMIIVPDTRDAYVWVKCQHAENHAGNDIWIERLRTLANEKYTCFDCRHKRRIEYDRGNAEHRKNERIRKKERGQRVRKEQSAAVRARLKAKQHPLVKY